VPWQFNVQCFFLESTWTVSGFSPGFPCQLQHRRYYKRDDLVVVETSELSDQASQARKRKCRWSSTRLNQAFISNLGLYSNLVGLAIPPRRLTRTTYLVWLQAAGKGWLGIQRNKKTLQPYESGIDGAIRQWLARVVLPRVLRFPPTKIFNTKRDGFTAGTPLSIHQKNKIILLDFRFFFQ